ncbi:hypothetical protein NQ317_013949 [Molorchus minor]|uniref:Mab-21-like HhH/H2TH-like domain-containing protein n=1 Tax=Molorchus minor TaxID=1323400 RepID=A0ABQ9JX43_9CUCU|nr:hypothetical protein NQ317_013949 [Molorchus minor]
MIRGPKIKEFFIVPKPHDNTKYWRLSFQEQERILLIGKENLKPALRLIKKIRDKLKHDCISSYFIKTVFLWKVIKTRKDHFWNKPLSYVFMKLHDYQGCIQRGVIKYFWCPRFNLIENIDDQTLSMISNDLKYIINNLKSPRQNETLVAKYLCKERNVKRIEWLAISPDMNVIEHVWSRIKLKLNGVWREFNNLNELSDSARNEWEAIPQEFIRNMTYINCSVSSDTNKQLHIPFCSYKITGGDALEELGIRKRHKEVTVASQEIRRPMNWPDSGSEGRCMGPETYLGISRQQVTAALIDWV